jgi:hypothetical protein
LSCSDRGSGATCADEAVECVAAGKRGSPWSRSRGGAIQLTYHAPSALPTWGADALTATTGGVNNHQARDLYTFGGGCDRCGATRRRSVHVHTNPSTVPACLSVADG